MNGIEEFTAFVRSELGMALTSEDLSRSFDHLAGWDSLHLLWLLTAFERNFGRSLPFERVLSASTLGEIYELAVSR
jgi:acyl carrier protein